MTKDSGTLKATPKTASPPTSTPVPLAESAPKQQAVALEVPVSVNGARTPEGSSKREPFSEATKTVLVFGAGAVIRLTSPVAPGQLLFLTNERTKKEVVCQVVKSKNYRNISGYVELEFTEPAVGFWGMRFPGDRIGSVPQPAPAANGSQVGVPRTGALPASGAPSNGAAKPPAPAPVKTSAEPKVEPKLVAPGAPVAPKSTSPAAPSTVAGSSIVPPALDSATFLGAPKPKATETSTQVAPKPASRGASEANRVEPLRKKPEPVSPVATVPPVPAVPKSTPESAVAQSAASPNFPTFDVTRTSEKPASLFTPAPEPPADLSKVDLSSLAPFFEAKPPAVPVEVEPLPPPVQVPIDPETETLKHQTARLQEELSNMIFSEPASDSAVESTLVAPSFPIAEKDETHEKPAQIFEPSNAPLPATILSEPVESLPAPLVPTSPVQTSPLNSLEQEELKIPAWLEPLARNAAAPSSTQELVLREKAKRFTDQPAEVEELTAEQGVPAEEERVSEVRIPEFGSALPIDEEESSEESRSTKSRKTMLYAVIGAGIVLLPAVGWWYVYQSRGAHGGVSTAEAQAVSAPATSSPTKPQEDAALQTNLPGQVAPVASQAPLGKGDSSVQANSGSKPSNSASAGSSASPAHNPQLSPNSPDSGTVVARSSTEQPASASAPAKKPTLGEVHLAAPKVAKNQRAQNGNSAEAEAGLSLEEARPETDADGLTSPLTVGNKGPAAPEAPPAVGGDVKQAKLISSVPPVYPTMAKSQHVSGNVTVDALIDATGRVTTMKVVSGPPLLYQAAMDALKQWKYQPAMLDGKAVPMHLSVTIQFRLQ